MGHTEREDGVDGRRSVHRKEVMLRSVGALAVHVLIAPHHCVWVLSLSFGEEETETQGKLKLAGFPQSGGRGAPGVAGHAEVRAGALTGLRRTFSSCPALGCARPPSASHEVLPGLPWVGSSGQVRAWL